MRTDHQSLLTFRDQHQEVPPDLQAGIKAMQELVGTNNDCFLMINKWNGLQIPAICQRVSEWRLPSTLFVQYNNHQGILQDISQIGFPHLRKLFLRNNMIDCIETLAQMSLPCLTEIWIGGNHVATIRSFRRCHFPHLTFFAICLNAIQELQSFSQLFAPKLSSIDLERSEDFNNSFSFRPFAKLETKSLSNVWALKNRRIRETFTYSVLKNKYTNLAIYVPS